MEEPEDQVTPAESTPFTQEMQEMGPEDLILPEVEADEIEDEDYVPEEALEEADEEEEDELEEEEEDSSAEEVEEQVGKKRRKRKLSLGPCSTYSCTKCERAFTSEKKLSEHLARHNRTFTCPQDGCTKEVFPTRGEIRKHFRVVHKTGHKDLLMCSICRMEFLTQEQLDDHTTAKHNFICSICGETFRKLSECTKHRASAHGGESLYCALCSQHFTTKGAHSKHMMRHRQKGKLMCEECGKEFTAQSTLYHHKKAFHQGIQPYKCTICSKSFNFNVSLKLHMLKHQGQFGLSQRFDIFHIQAEISQQQYLYVHVAHKICKYVPVCFGLHFNKSLTVLRAS